MFKFAESYDQIVHCSDASDEISCECENNEFKCDCIPNGTCYIKDRCKDKAELVDGFARCPDGRILLRNQTRFDKHRLHNVSKCNDNEFPGCDSSTCLHTDFCMCVDDSCFESHVLCTSYCDHDLCRGIFQCSDNRTIFVSRFCDEIVDCIDGNDEFTNQPSLKCNNCVVPQNDFL